MILTVPNPVLRTHAAAVPEGACVRELVSRMTKALGPHLGIAAPQIGVSKRVIIVGTDLGNIPMVNPEIVARSVERCLAREACLSVPGKSGMVSRYLSITVEYRDVSGGKHREAFTGLTARCIQHEIDHLDGILFTDRAR